MPPEKKKLLARQYMTSAVWDLNRSLGVARGKLKGSAATVRCVNQAHH